MADFKHLSLLCVWRGGWLIRMWYASICFRHLADDVEWLQLSAWLATKRRGLAAKCISMRVGRRRYLTNAPWQALNIRRHVGRQRRPRGAGDVFPHSTTSGSSSGSWSGQFNGELMWSVDVVSHLNDPASPRPPPRVISAGTDGGRERKDRQTDARMDGWIAGQLQTLN